MKMTVTRQANGRTKGSNHTWIFDAHVGIPIIKALVAG
jgi:hypothetical protein